MWGRLGGDGGCYFGVFFVDEAEHVEGGELVDVLGEGVAGFGEEVCEFHGGIHDTRWRGNST